MLCKEHKELFVSTRKVIFTEQVATKPLNVPLTNTKNSETSKMDKNQCYVKKDIFEVSFLSLSIKLSRELVRCAKLLPNKLS